MDIVKEAYTDHTQFDKKDPHYDPKSSKVCLNLWFIYELDRTLIHREILNFTINFEVIGKPIEKLYKKG